MNKREKGEKEFLSFYFLPKGAVKTIRTTIASGTCKNFLFFFFIEVHESKGEHK